MTAPEYEWWPDGAAETYVRECNCEFCGELIERLEHERTDGQPTDPAPGDGDLSLEAFTS
jgi:hypothetical protein